MNFFCSLPAITSSPTPKKKFNRFFNPTKCLVQITLPLQGPKNVEVPRSQYSGPSFPCSVSGPQKTTQTKVFMPEVVGINRKWFLSATRKRRRLGGHMQPPQGCAQPPGKLGDTMPSPFHRFHYWQGVLEWLPHRYRVPTLFSEHKNHTRTKMN